MTANRLLWLLFAAALLLAAGVLVGVVVDLELPRYIR